jgi:lysophospholipase L1-like esterase
LYVDGVAIGGTNAGTGGTPTLNSRTVKWGVRDNNGTLEFFYTGKIDDARIYSSALSPVYVAVGDSITAGSHDSVTSDGLGFEPILSDLLSASKEAPVLFANVGMSGATSADGAASIFATLAAYPAAQHYLILYGSNDAFDPPVPSGLGMNPGDPGYSGSYKDSMQQIITAVVGAGKTPYLAKVPFANFPGITDSTIQEYNAVIDELVSLNGIQVTPPDLYTYFRANQNQLADGLHPNEQGYQAIANMWFGQLQFIP